MGIFNWRGRISKTEFRKRYVAALRAAAPSIECADSANELDFSVTGLPHHSSATVSLQRAYDEFIANPSAREEIQARWTQALLGMWFPKPLERANVMPMIKDRKWVANHHAKYAEPLGADSDQNLWIDEYNEELVIAYADYGAGISYLHRSDLSELKMTREEGRALALSNLRARTPQRDFIERDGLWAINAGGNFEAALLLDDALWDDQRFAGTQRLLAAVPERNLILASNDATPAGVWHLAGMAAAGHRSQPYPISAQLLVRRGGRFELLDPVAVDETHPIPNLDVIDVHAIQKAGGADMNIVVATPLQADPRSAFRLFRKLDGYLTYIASPGFRSECGSPTPNNTRITVLLHPDSDPAWFDLLGGMIHDVKKHGASLRVECLM